MLLGSTIILQISESTSPLGRPLLLLYGLTAGIFLLSFIYALIFNRIKHEIIFGYIQTCIDTIIVTLIIYVTGGFASIFTFLYLVIIIYSGMLLFRKDTLIIAVFCSIQYSLMVGLEYYEILQPDVLDAGLAAASYPIRHVFYNVTITVLACFAVAFLCGLFSEQARETKEELLAMEDHVRRVDKMAAIGGMAAGLAHELKNPLASLTGSIQLLRENLHSNPEHDKLIRIFLREANRLSVLVNNFLLFAKLPAGKVEVIDLSKDLAETVVLFEKDHTSKKIISITNEFSSGIWTEIDPTHLRQIFWNLLLNAAEATEGSEGLIDIILYPMNSDHVGIKITDNGCGIPKDKLQAIFDPFFTTKQSGTGLGLSIVHSILESYDSRLDVESEVGKGTTFTLKFKMVDPPT